MFDDEPKVEVNLIGDLDSPDVLDLVSESCEEWCQEKALEKTQPIVYIIAQITGLLCLLSTGLLFVTFCKMLEPVLISYTTVLILFGSLIFSLIIFISLGCFISSVVYSKYLDEMKAITEAAKEQLKKSLTEDEYELID